MLFTNKSSIISNSLLLSLAMILLAKPSYESIVEDCAKDGLATVSSIELTGCDFDKDPLCVLKRGTNATIAVGLVPNSEISDAKVNVGARIGGLYVPFPLKPDDACEAYGLTCPMAKDSAQKVTISLPIKQAYPSPPNMKVQFKLVTSDKKDIFCVTFPAKIVS